MKLTASEFVASLYGQKEQDLSVGKKSDDPLFYGPAVRLRKQLWEKISIRGDDANSAYAELFEERCLFINKKVTFENAEFSHSTWIKALKHIDGYGKDNDLRFFKRLNCWLINHLRLKYFLSWYCLIFFAIFSLTYIVRDFNSKAATGYYWSWSSVSLIFFFIVISFILAWASLVCIENMEQKPTGKYLGRGKDLLLARRLIFQEMSSDARLRDSDIACNFYKTMENDMHPVSTDVDPETIMNLEKEVKKSHESIAALSKVKEELENKVKTLQKSVDDSSKKCTDAQNELEASKKFTLNSCMLLLGLLEMLRTVAKITNYNVIWNAFKERADQIEKERGINLCLRDRTVNQVKLDAEKKLIGQSFDKSWYGIDPRENASYWPPVQRSKPVARVTSTE